jgi:signal peptidase II
VGLLVAFSTISQFIKNYGLPMKYKGYYLLFLVLVLLDQFSKQIFISSFDVGQSIIVNPYLSWTYLQNTGAAFSILADGGGIQKAFLLSVSVLASVIIFLWIQKTSEYQRQKLFGQFLLLSGAVGNLIDRAQYGYVVDFIDVHVNGFYWPVFNLADSFIFIGVLLLLFQRKQPSL